MKHFHRAVRPLTGFSPKRTLSTMRTGTRVKLSAAGLSAFGLTERGFGPDTRGTVVEPIWPGLDAVLVDGEELAEHWKPGFWERVDAPKAPVKLKPRRPKNLTVEAIELVRRGESAITACEKTGGSIWGVWRYFRKNPSERPSRAPNVTPNAAEHVSPEVLKILKRRKERADFWRKRRLAAA